MRRNKKQEQKQIFIILSIVAAVLVIAVTGIALTMAGKKEGKEKDKISAHKPSVETVNKDETDKDNVEVTDKEEVVEEEEEEQQKGEPEIVLDESKAVAMKTTSNVNFRKEAGMTGKIIRLLSKGTELKKYSEENGWALVKVGDEIGYVSTSYLVDPIKEPEKPETPTTSSKVEAIPGQHRDPNKIVVVIDPGHQRYGNSVREPDGPGSGVMKARVTSGATGKFTGVPEYVLNLQVSLKLRTELQNRGYTVYMTRDNHDVDISNMERAQYATTVGADIAVRIHANGNDSPAVKGALTMAPSSNNPYVSHLANASYSLSKKIIDAYCAATGFENDGVLLSDTMTGMNWSSVPVTIVEMGYMSNEHDDRAMQDATMQNNMVQGIANGIDAYFGL